jgi:hypothetical protein
MAGQPKSRVREAAASRGPIVKRLTPAWQDEDLIDAICTDLADGCSFETTGLAHGLGRDTLGKWTREAVEVVDTLAHDPSADIDADPERVLVGARLLRAHAGASQQLERRLHQGEVWALEILARRHRQTWGRQEHLTIDGTSGTSEVAGLLDRIAQVRAETGGAEPSES